MFRSFRKSVFRNFLLFVLLMPTIAAGPLLETSARTGDSGSGMVTNMQTTVTSSQSQTGTAQAPAPAPRVPTRADILRGEYGRYRANNDLLFYHLDIRVDPEKKFISGKTTIRFKMLKDDTRIQIDLHDALNVDKIVEKGKGQRAKGDTGAKTVSNSSTDINPKSEINGRSLPNAESTPRRRRICTSRARSS